MQQAEFDLISDNPPRPLAPVAMNPEVADCKDDTNHAWHCYWGNKSARHYRYLSCLVEVKERKCAPRWVGFY